MIDRLIDIIAREADLFESFLDLLEQQQRALVENDVDSLTLITERQHEKTIEARLIEKKREELVEKIKADRSIDGDLTMNRLLGMIDSQHATRLKNLRELIYDLNDKILKVRNQNAMLLNRSREYIRTTMDMLSRVGNPKGNYTNSGEEQSGRMNLVMDRRA